MIARIVIQTNVFVSYLIRPASLRGQAVVRALQEFRILASAATRAEVIGVLKRPKFDRYISASVREPFLEMIWSVSESISIPTPIRVCRDPRDDKFLELAVHGRANFIVTGDRDLLLLNPFQGTAIVTPAEFLAHVTELPGTQRLS